MLTRFMRLLGLPILLAACTAYGQDRELRIKQAQADIDEAKAMLAEVTNADDRAVWQNRISLGEQDIANIKRLGELEEREKSFAKAQKRSALLPLREALRSIETNTTEPARKIHDDNDLIVKLKKQRAQYEDQRTQVDPDAVADLNQRIQNVDAEILARELDRDACDLQIHLAQDVQRVDDFVRTLPPTVHPTIRVLLDKRRYIATEVKLRTDLQAQVDSLTAQRKETDASLSLSKQRFDQMDNESRILQNQYQIERKTVVTDPADKEKSAKRQARVGHLLSAAKGEKVFLNDRITSIGNQISALDQSIAVAGQQKDLIEREIAFLTEDFSVARKLYFRSVLMPLSVIGGMIVVYQLLSHLLFPLFFSRDGLFVARRLCSYLLALLIICVLAVFFLEDLKAIATVMGIATAAIVIALQDMCSAFAGWFVIIASRKIKVGDRVEIDGHRGDVLDIQLLRTTLLELNNWLGVDEATGRIIIVPNSFIFKTQVFNYSHVHPYVWGKLEITMTYETPFREAHELLARILEEETREEFAAAARGAGDMEKKYGVPDTVYKPKIFTTLADSGVLFNLVYVCHYKKVSSTRGRINARIMSEFDKDKRMQLAYPTQRIIPTPEPAGFPVTQAKH